MGKTFKQEKSFKPKRRPLNTHRDLPDDPEVILGSDYPDEDEEAERYYGENLRVKERDNEFKKDSKTP